jgi:hypothetical protein
MCCLQAGSGKAKAHEDDESDSAREVKIEEAEFVGAEFGAGPQASRNVWAAERLSINGQRAYSIGTGLVRSGRVVLSIADAHWKLVNHHAAVGEI